MRADRPPEAQLTEGGLYSEDIVPPRQGGIVFVLSGPSGAGKDTVLAKLQLLEPDLHYCVTATTRAPRPGEQDGVDYFFVTQAGFEELRDTGGLLEWDRHFDNYYGVPAEQITNAIARNQDVLACIDIHGAMSIKSRIPAAVLTFLAPSSVDELRERLGGRGTESSAQLELRLADARMELARIPDFDYLVINGNGQLDAAVQAVHGIIETERRRVHPRYAVLDGVTHA